MPTFLLPRTPGFSPAPRRPRGLLELLESGAGDPAMTPLQVADSRNPRRDALDGLPSPLAPSSHGPDLSQVPTDVLLRYLFDHHLSPHLKAPQTSDGPAAPEAPVRRPVSFKYRSQPEGSEEDERNEEREPSIVEESLLPAFRWLSGQMRKKQERRPAAVTGPRG